MIGVFDSGVGGLTVVKEIRKKLPDASILYLGDTAHLPYGNKSPEAITNFSLRNTRFLIERGAEMVVIACHSSASVATEELRRRFSLPILTVVEAGAKAVAKKRPEKVGVIGTIATIESGSYINQLRKEGVKGEIIARACPLMVSLVEEGILEGRVAEVVVDHYLSQFRSEGIDILLLGCTHFPMLIPVMEKILPGVELIDPGQVVADELSKQSSFQGDGRLVVYLTDLSYGFRSVAERFLGEEVGEIVRITLEE